MKSAKALASLQGHAVSLESVRFAPDGKSLSSTADDPSIKVWDVATGRCLTTLGQEKISGHPLACSLDCASFAARSVNSLTIWDIKTGKRKAAFETADVTAIAFCPDRETVVSGSRDGRLILWNIHTGKSRSLKGHFRVPFSLAWSPDGKWLASGNWNDTVLLWDARTGQKRIVLAAHRDQILSLAFSPDG